MLLVLGRRLFFDPLSKFPGPWLNAVSDIPAALRLISGRQHAYHRRLHEKYGTVANPAPNRHSRRTGIIADFNANFFIFQKDLWSASLQMSLSFAARTHGTTFMETRLVSYSRDCAR